MRTDSPRVQRDGGVLALIDNGDPDRVVGLGDASLDEALAVERRAVHACSGTKDEIEGMTALLEKRPPVFTGE